MGNLAAADAAWAAFPAGAPRRRRLRWPFAGGAAASSCEGSSLSSAPRMSNMLRVAMARRGAAPEREREEGCGRFTELLDARG